MVNIAHKAPDEQSLQGTSRFSASVSAHLVLIVLSSWAGAQESAPLPSPSKYSIKVKVDMVVLRATAQDHKNVLREELHIDPLLRLGHAADRAAPHAKIRCLFDT
jgi:hypothetical protein